MSTCLSMCSLGSCDRSSLVGSGLGWATGKVLTSQKLQACGPELQELVRARKPLVPGRGQGQPSHEGPLLNFKMSRPGLRVP